MGEIIKGSKKKKSEPFWFCRQWCPFLKKRRLSYSSGDVVLSEWSFSLSHQSFFTHYTFLCGFIQNPTLFLARSLLLQHVFIHLLTNSAVAPYANALSVLYQSRPLLAKLKSELVCGSKIPRIWFCVSIKQKIWLKPQANLKCPALF